MQESSLGLLPVQECVSGAQHPHEGKRMQEQEELKSKDPGHSHQNTGFEKAGGTTLALLEMEAYPLLNQINHLFNLGFLFLPSLYHNCHLSFFLGSVLCLLPLYMVQIQ